MIRPLPVVEVSSACDKRGVSVILRPINRFLLGVEDSEHLRTILYNVIVYAIFLQDGPSGALR